MSDGLPFRLRLQLALREFTGFTSNAKLDGLVLATYIDDEGKAWPALDTLERVTSTTRKTVLNGLDELEAAGVLNKERGRHHNTYWLRLTPELERVVDAFLADARSRSGQLHLPLDRRGLHLAKPAAEWSGSTPGVESRPDQGGVVPPETDTEVFNEVGTGLSDEDPLADLVADLADADDGTLHVFRSHFGHLSAWHVGHAHDELRRRRKNTRRGPLLSEVRYAFSALQRRKTGAA